MAVSTEQWAKSKNILVSLIWFKLIDLKLNKSEIMIIFLEKFLEKKYSSLRLKFLLTL